MDKIENFKSGFVNIVGNPNVGKSTLMNQLPHAGGYALFLSQRS